MDGDVWAKEKLKTSEQITRILTVLSKYKEIPQTKLQQMLCINYAQLHFVLHTLKVLRIIEIEKLGYLNIIKLTEKGQKILSHAFSWNRMNLEMKDNEYGQNRR